MLPLKPFELGLPAKFQNWRPHQSEAVECAHNCQKRFLCQAVPTGGGKSLTYIAHSILTGKRCAILTSTKGLQSQLSGDFEGAGLVDVRGRNNYQCKMGPGVNCEYGHHAGCPSDKTDACDYWRAYRKACASQLVVTNYAYWMLIHQFGEGLGRFDLLILDESHAAPDEVCNIAAVDLTHWEVYDFMRVQFPHSDENVVEWKDWAAPLADEAKIELDALQKDIREYGASDRKVRELLQWKSLYRKFSEIAGMRGPWEVESTQHGYRLDPLWPSQYAESYLFRGTPQVCLYSATVVPKTVDILGVPAEDYEYREYPSTFPPSRSPVIHIPTIKLSRHTTPEEEKLWLARMDQIISGRLDRKGIIHSVSYNRRDRIMTHSEFAGYMIGHDSKDAQYVVEKFKRMRPPAILVSPSMSTGWDFPRSDCEYQIISKIPFPDSRSKIMQAREKEDKLYSPYLMAQALVQSCGRATRSAEDHSENFILDDHIRWVIKAYRSLFPSWWRRLYRRSLTVPPPPPPLRREHSVVESGFQSQR